MSVEREGVVELLAELHLSVCNPFFATFVESDMKNSNMNALYVWQSGLLMGNRDYYIEEANAAIKGGYELYLQQILKLAGLSEEQAVRGAAATVVVEDEIAKISRSNVALRDMAACYNPMPIADVKRSYDAIDWEAYFKILGVETPQTLIVGQPEVMALYNNLLKSLTIDQIRYYLAAHYINAASGYLSDDFYAANFDFYGRQMSGKQEPRPRWKRAMATTDGAFQMAVGKMYVDK